MSDKPVFVPNLISRTNHVLAVGPWPDCAIGGSILTTVQILSTESAGLSENPEAMGDKDTLEFRGKSGRFRICYQR